MTSTYILFAQQLAYQGQPVWIEESFDNKVDADKAEQRLSQEQPGIKFSVDLVLTTA